MRRNSPASRRRMAWRTTARRSCSSPISARAFCIASNWRMDQRESGGGLRRRVGVTWDYYGRLYISSWKTGKVFVIPKPGEKPGLVVEGFKSAADCCLDPSGRFILVPDMLAGTLTAIPAQVRELRWMRSRCRSRPRSPSPTSSGPAGVPRRAGRANPLRPIVLTHAGDGSNRVFVATQHGVVHMFPNDPKAAETTVVLDIQGARAVRRPHQRGRLTRHGLPSEVQGDGRGLHLLHPETPVAARRDAERGGAVPAQQGRPHEVRSGQRGANLRVP